MIQSRQLGKHFWLYFTEQSLSLQHAALHYQQLTVNSKSQSPEHISLHYLFFNSKVFNCKLV